MDAIYMKMALAQAKKAVNNDDIPVGCVIVSDGEVLSKAYNKKHKNNDPTCHAEILAIKKACRKVNDFRLENAEVYVTLEPCIMCYGALLSARVKTIYFGAYDKKYSIKQLQDNIKFNHSANVVGGVMEEECGQLLSSFFEKLRREKC